MEGDHSMKGFKTGEMFKESVRLIRLPRLLFMAVQPLSR